MEMKRQTKTFKWYVKDIYRTLKEGPIDWYLASYIAICGFAVILSYYLGQGLIYLLDQFAEQLVRV